MLQSKVMEVTQRLQPVQDKACQLFTEVESRGAELEQVVLAVEQCLEGPVNDTVIQSSPNKRPQQSSKSKHLEPSLRHSRQNCSDQSDSG
jgi:hypothetical protein